MKKIARDLIEAAKVLVSYYPVNWAKKTEYKGIEMELVGTWRDLAGYYRGSDGNYWSVRPNGRNWSNNGESLRNYRGETLDGKPLSSLPKLASSRRFEASDISLLDAMIRTYRQVVDKLSARVSSVKGVEGQIHDDEKVRRRDYIRIMSWDAYTRSDFQAKIILYVSIEGLDSYVNLEIETPYGKQTHINGEEFKGVIPVDTILKTIEGALR